MGAVTQQKRKRGRPAHKSDLNPAQTPSITDPRPDVQANQQNTEKFIASMLTVLNETTLDIRLQRERLQNDGTTLLAAVRKLTMQTPALRTAVEEPKRAPKIIVRCSLATDDNDTVDLLTDKKIADSFQAEGGIWSHVRATDRKPGLLHLYLDSSDVKADIEKQVWKVPRILGVSARCNGLSDHYLVVAVRFAFRQATLPKPKDHIVDWSHHNGVSIVQASWRHAQLILSMASKEDASTLCSKPSVFLDGQEGEVEPIDQRAIPLFCSNCWSPNYKRYHCNSGPEYGKCASTEHISWDCDGNLPIKCRNCAGAHEAWSLKCRHVEVMKMRDNCTRWREKGPPWTPHSQQRSSRGGPSRKEPRSRGSIRRTDFDGSSNIHSSQYEKPGAPIDLPQKRKLSPSAELDIQRRPKNQPRLQFTSNRKSTPDDPLPIQTGPGQTPDNPLSAQHRPRPTAGNPLKSSLKPSNSTRSRRSLDQRSLDNGLLAPENPPARPPSSSFDFTPPQPDQIACLKLKRFQNSPDQPQLEAFFSKPACSQEAEPRGWKKYIPGWRTE